MNRHDADSSIDHHTAAQDRLAREWRWWREAFLLGLAEVRRWVRRGR